MPPLEHRDAGLRITTRIQLKSNSTQFHKNSPLAETLIASVRPITVRQPSHTRHQPLHHRTLPACTNIRPRAQPSLFAAHAPTFNLFNRQLNEQGLDLEPVDELDFRCITEGDFPIEEMPGRWFNFIDLESAIELYTPMYQLLLTDSDFWRACNSLQLDETISIYATQLVGEHKFLGLVNNRHPIVPESVLGAAHRLMLHGLAVESLHAYLVALKRRSNQVTAIAPTPGDAGSASSE